MKQKILLLFAVAACSVVYAQKNSKVTAFAITGSEKGSGSWNEVRLVDISTGDEVKKIYGAVQDIQVLNARTGKPIVKKDLVSVQELQPSVQVRQAPVARTIMTTTSNANKNTNSNTNVNVNCNTNVERVIMVNREVRAASVQSDKPFATNSAACAYDKKHERLYYTPMGINQLRYIDLSSKTPKIYYFENESFGALKNRSDVSNQITRMVMGSDGNGYALSNDGNHLIRFTTGKKPEITDLGALTDDATNGKFSVHSSSGYGGDMIADAQKNLYLITANRMVFKISIDNKIATLKGSIQGIPRGFSTNGAIVEEGSNVIVCSSNSTQGYYRFDLNDLKAERISGSAVFNASDLANGTLAYAKKKKEKKEKDVKPDLVYTPAVSEEDPEEAVASTEKTGPRAQVVRNSIGVYPNPVRNGLVKLSFSDQPSGKYQVQFMDVTGKVMSTKDVTINNRVQVEEFILPSFMTAGNYLVKIVSEANNVVVVNKLIVE